MIRNERLRDFRMLRAMTIFVLDIKPGFIKYANLG